MSDQNHTYKRGVWHLTQKAAVYALAMIAGAYCGAMGYRVLQISYYQHRWQALWTDRSVAKKRVLVASRRLPGGQRIELEGLGLQKVFIHDIVDADSLGPTDVTYVTNSIASMSVEKGQVLYRWMLVPLEDGCGWGRAQTDTTVGSVTEAAVIGRTNAVHLSDPP